MVEHGCVDINLTGHGRGKVSIDGVEIAQVKSITLTSAADDLNRLTIEIIPSQVKLRSAVTLVSPVTPEMDRPSMDFFEWRRFGWPDA